MDYRAPMNRIISQRQRQSAPSPSIRRLPDMRAPMNYRVGSGGVNRDLLYRPDEDYGRNVLLPQPHGGPLPKNTFPIGGGPRDTFRPYPGGPTAGRAPRPRPWASTGREGGTKTGPWMVDIPIGGGRAVPKRTGTPAAPKVTPELLKIIGALGKRAGEIAAWVKPEYDARAQVARRMADQRRRQGRIGPVGGS